MATATDAIANGIASHPDNAFTQQESQAGPIPTSDLSRDKYPRWIGSKFEPDGKVLPFPGNTIICHLSSKSELYRSLLIFFDDLREQEIARLYVLLPPTSWHMTVSEGLSDKIRQSQFWSGDLPIATRLQDCNIFMQEKLANFKLGNETSFRMAFAGWEPLEDGIALKIVPASEDEETRLRSLRNRLADHLSIRHPGHETYSFHVSLAYTLRYLNHEEFDTTMALLEEWRTKLPPYFELGPPEFCLFDDMFDFRKQFCLK